MWTAVPAEVTAESAKARTPSTDDNDDDDDDEDAVVEQVVEADCGDGASARALNCGARRVTARRAKAARDKGGRGVEEGARAR